MKQYESDLLRYYAEDAHNRKYHSVSHVLDLLQLLHTNTLPGLKPLPIDYVGWGMVPLFVKPAYVEAAIYGHDIIYDTGPKDLNEASNEQQSAIVTASLLQSHGWSFEEADIVRQFIEATEPPHCVPDNFHPDLVQDCQLLLSMDLAVGLALEGPKMHAATDAIRFEYRQYTDEQWTAGRRKFFESMLNKNVIFPHQLCELTWGPIARKNMEAGLKRLGA